MMLTLNSAEEGNSLMNTLSGSDDEKQKMMILGKVWYLSEAGF